MNVLAIGCHPDDIEISCAGTLAKFAKRGDKVTVCHVCNGDMGHAIIQPDELRVMRIGEAKKAGSLAGIEVITTDIGDLLPNGCDIKQRDLIVDIITFVFNFVISIISWIWQTRNYSFFTIFGLKLNITLSTFCRINIFGFK